MMQPIGKVYGVVLTSIFKSVLYNQRANIVSMFRVLGICNSSNPL